MVSTVYSKLIKTRSERSTCMVQPILLISSLRSMQGARPLKFLHTISSIKFSWSLLMESLVICKRLLTRLLRPRIYRCPLLLWELVMLTLNKWTISMQMMLPYILGSLRNTRVGITSNLFLSENSRTTHTSWRRKPCKKSQDSWLNTSLREVFSQDPLTKLKDRESHNSCLWEPSRTPISSLICIPNN